ncbi:Putative ABC transporter, substrate-binding protein [Escherichia coli]|uniref:ABC transporter, substrate-binding protein n=1 Tax=Escherichia coli TaxID=562 RepID=A0A376TWB5_ECOLX|nr:Putative ABC transporter, substrate-binding protein [Escherichia coli]
MKKMMIAHWLPPACCLPLQIRRMLARRLMPFRKGFVQCGISDGLPGFSYADADGKFSGIDVDVCRGVAAAVFGDDTKVKLYPTHSKRTLHGFTVRGSGFALP